MIPKLDHLSNSENGSLYWKRNETWHKIAITFPDYGVWSGLSEGPVRLGLGREMSQHQRLKIDKLEGMVRN